MAAERYGFGLDDDGIGGIPVAVRFNRVQGTEPKAFLETLQALKDKIPQVERWAKKSKQDADQWKRSKYKDHVLSANLLAALLKYTAQDTEPPLFKYMNGVCCTPSRTGIEDLVDFMWLLLHAMATLEPFGNRTVYRGVKKDLSAKFNKDSVGDEITWHSFTSCTRKLGLMDDPNFCGTSGKRTIFSIQLTQGQARYIAPFSNFPEEEEVLIPPCCRFVVESVAQQGDQTLVQLEEVESLEWILDLRELTEVLLRASCLDTSPTQGGEMPAAPISAMDLAPTETSISKVRWHFKEAPKGTQVTLKTIGDKLPWLLITDGGQVAGNPDVNGRVAELQEALHPNDFPVRLSIEMPDSQRYGHGVYLRHPDTEEPVYVNANAAGRYHVTVTTTDFSVSPCDCGGRSPRSGQKSQTGALPWSLGSTPLKFGVYLYAVSEASVARTDSCSWV